MISSDNLTVWAEQLASGNGVLVVITVDYGSSNEVCTNTVTSSRKKRATSSTLFNQNLLIDILNDEAV